MDFQEVGREDGLDWAGSEQGQVEGSCECRNEAYVSIKYGEYHH